MMSKPRHRIAIVNHQRLVPVNRKLLRRAIRAVLEGEGINAAEISLAIVSDGEIARLNKTYLNHEGPTDVITFPLSRPGASPLEGEIVVSIETAVREAGRRGLHPDRELCLYVVHGMLHLCGYDDLDPKARRRMRGRERHYLKHLADSGLASS